MTNPFENKWAADFWGMIARDDWKQYGNNWNISGSGPGDGTNDMYGGPVFDSKAEAEAYIAANRPAGPTPSENAYNASLAAMGIDPSELPYGQVGQEATARVMQQHGQQIPDYLKAWLPKAAGGGKGAQPNLLLTPAGQPSQYGFDFSQMNDLGPTGRMGYGGQPGSDPMSANASGRFLARTQQDTINAQAQMTRDMIRKVMLQGQPGSVPNKPNVSPALLRAAQKSRRGRVAPTANWIDNPY